MHQRQSLRLPEYDYSSPGAYFVTIVTHSRECFLGQVVEDVGVLSECGKIVEKVWMGLPSHYPHVELGTFSVMPNHVHGIVIIRDVGEGSRQPLTEVVRGFKSFSARWINQFRKTAGKSVWQRSFYEHVVRNEADYQAIHDYILANPMNWNQDELRVKPSV